jgi:hypothetical protein
MEGTMAARPALKRLWCGAACAVSLLAGSQAQAQFLGLNLRGDVGLRSGSQPPPGVYFTLPLYYGNDYSGLRDQDGHMIADNLDVNFDVLATPAFALTTKAKIFGGTLGLQAVLPFMGTRLAIAEPTIAADQSYGVADIYVQPFLLGWRTDRADYRVGYAFFAPTGSGRRSLDMWAHEISAGSTLYLDDRQLWHLAATAFYEIHQTKTSEDVRVGDILTVEGGLGGSFLKGAGSLGVAYVAQWKITNDSGDDFPARLPKSKSRVFGLGPDLTLPVFAVGSIVGLLNARYVWEFGGRTTFEGNTFVAGFTLAALQRP